MQVSVSIAFLTCLATAWAASQGNADSALNDALDASPSIYVCKATQFEGGCTDLPVTRGNCRMSIPLELRAITFLIH
jgi:hypothetical protein